MSNDIVKQKNQLVIAKKMKRGQMSPFDEIAHEIKNPLTPIQLSSEKKS